MIDPTDIPARLLLAYRNEEFLDTPDARPLRILSEYLYPLSHFRKEKISDTIVFFGSARTFEASASGRYYTEARQLAHRLTEWSVNLEEPQPLRGVHRRRSRASWKPPIAAPPRREARPSD